jgi:16S rRNA (uracil1498-N3)-methyltransferase
MERYDYTTKRLFTDADLQAGGAVEAGREQANYLLNVLRMREGDPILLFNARDGEWLARVVPQGRKACMLVPEKQTREQPAPADLLYCFAPLKSARLDYMVQKAVEMGAGVLQPVITQYTQVHRLNLERMRANAVEAAEQCGILAIPRVGEPVTLEAMLKDWDNGRALVHCDESAADGDAIELLRPLAGKPLGVLVGPEGGFSPAERERLRGFAATVAIPLGPRILRADTAAVAALAVMQAAAGDWRPVGGAR